LLQPIYLTMISFHLLPVLVHNCWIYLFMAC